jgi:hypothetical protein
VQVNALFTHSLIYLLTDVLYNCGSKIIPNAKKYREELQDHLPEIFEKINEFMKNTSKITAISLEKQLDTILKNWENWRVYDHGFINGLKMTLKIPKDFNPKVFEDDETIIPFNSDFDYIGKAKSAAMDIAKLNYKRLQHELHEGKLNLKLMCYDNGINIEEGELTNDQMLMKINTLMYMELVEGLKACQENKLSKQDSKISQKDEYETQKKDINIELIKMYDLYSHINRVIQTLEGKEEGIPLTEEDIKMFGLQEDLNNIQKKYSKAPIVSKSRGGFVDVGDASKDGQIIEVDTSVGEMKIVKSSLSTNIATLITGRKIDEEIENMDGQEIVNTSWLDSMNPKKSEQDISQLQWLSVQMHKDVYKKLTISQSKFAKTNNKKEEEMKVDKQEVEKVHRQEIPIRGRGRGRGRGMGMGPVSVETRVTTHQLDMQRLRSTEVEMEGNSSDSDMKSRSRSSSNSSLSID